MLRCTYDESQQFVGQQAGGDEGHPQADVQLLGQLWPNPHEQTVKTPTCKSLTRMFAHEAKCADKLTFLFSPGCWPSSQTDSVTTKQKKPLI